MNFSTTPPWASISGTGHRKIAAQHPVDVLGVGAFRRRCEADQIAEQRCDELALLGERRPPRGGSREPQALQNRDPSGFTVRQTGHMTVIWGKE